MADTKGSAIHEPTPATAPHAATIVPTDVGGEQLCEGCGASRHGSVGREVECISAALRRERAQNRRQQSELIRLRKLAADVAEALRAI
jgi:hypothetical protein